MRTKSFYGEIKSIFHHFWRAFICQKLSQTWQCTFKPIQDGGSNHPPPPTPHRYYFFQLLQTQELADKTFWLLVSILSPHLCKISRPYLVPILDYETFWSNPYKVEVIITSLIEMLQLPNFGHMTTSTI